MDLELRQEDALRQINEKLDKLLADFNDFRVHVEGRLTKVETRAGIFALITGAISGGILSFFGK